MMRHEAVLLFILRPMMKLYGSSPEATGDGAEDLFPRVGIKTALLRLTASLTWPSGPGA